MEQYLIDTNITSFYFSAAFSSKRMQFMDSVIDSIPNISVITQIELLCWNTEAPTMEKVKEFISDSSVLNITPEIIDHCVAVLKSKKIKTPDAIIAATALAYSYTLITRNENDFLNINGLKIINPEKL